MGIVQNVTFFMYLDLLCYVLVKEAEEKEERRGRIAWMIFFLVNTLVTKHRESATV